MKQPQTIVAFENKSGFVVCLFMLGSSREKVDFLRISNSLQQLIRKNLNSDRIIFSPSEKLPECIFP